MTTPDRTDGRRRSTAATWRRRLALLLAVVAWVWVCITWLFPWIVAQGLDPTLGA